MATKRIISRSHTKDRTNTNDVDVFRELARARISFVGSIVGLLVGYAVRSMNVWHEPSSSMARGLYSANFL